RPRQGSSKTGTERSFAVPAVRAASRSRTSPLASMGGKNPNAHREQSRKGAEMENATSTSFEGRVALVTGGSSGIGAAVALQLAQAGAKVLITGRHETALKASAVRHPGLAYVVADVARPDDVARSLGEVKKRFGRLDALVNNAGILEMASLADAAPAHVRRTWETNVDGLIETTRAT